MHSGFIISYVFLFTFCSSPHIKPFGKTNLSFRFNAFTFIGSVWPHPPLQHTLLSSLLLAFRNRNSIHSFMSSYMRINRRDLSFCAHCSNRTHVSHLGYNSDNNSITCRPHWSNHNVRVMHIVQHVVVQTTMMMVKSTSIRSMQK